jgi:hypothetical protein
MRQEVRDDERQCPCLDGRLVYYRFESQSDGVRHLRMRHRRKFHFGLHAAT